MQENRTVDPHSARRGDLAGRFCFGGLSDGRGFGGVDLPGEPAGRLWVDPPGSVRLAAGVGERLAEHRLRAVHQGMVAA